DLEMVGQLGVRRLRRLPDFGTANTWLLEQFVVAGDCLGETGRLANPDRQRRAPVALARQGPIDVGLQKVSEPPVANVLRQPIDLLIVLELSLLELRRANEPALRGVLDQRVLVRPPAEGILVHVLLLMVEQAAMPQVAGDVAIGLLDPAALKVRRLAGE